MTEYGFGLFATAALAADEEIASIPLSLVLTHQKAEDSEVGRAVAELNALQASRPSSSPHPARHISPRTLLYLFMIHCLHEPSSPFRLYVSSFPPCLSPLHWPSSALSLLAGTNLQQAVPVRLLQLRRRYDNVFPLAFRLFPSVFSAAHFTFDAFLWAHTALTSRGFPVQVGQSGSAAVAGQQRAQAQDGWVVTSGVMRKEGDKKQDEYIGCMLPLLDMTNHRLRTPITWLTTPAAAAAATSSPSTEGRVSFRTGAAVVLGAEVLNNYGAKSNEEFLLGYGFCLLDNPYDELALQIAGLTQQQQHLLSLYAVQHRHRGHYLTPSTTPASLLVLLRVACLTRAELSLLSSLPYGQQRLQRVGARNEVAMLRLLRGMLLGRLQRMGSAGVEEARQHQEEDSTRVKTAELTEEERLALLYRSGQRGLLINALDRTDSELQAQGSKAASAPRTLYRLRSGPTSETDSQLLQRCGADWSRVVPPALPSPSPSLLIPSALVITPATIRDFASFAPALEYAQGLTPHQELSLFLLHHLQLQTASPLHPLLTCLHHSSHPSHALASSVTSSCSAFDVSSHDRDDAQDVYQQLFPALSDADAEVFQPEWHTLSNWLWAHYTVHRQTVRLASAVGNDAAETEPMLVLPLCEVPAWASSGLCEAQWEAAGLRLRPVAGGALTRVEDEEDDGCSVSCRGEFLAGGRRIIRVSSSSLLPPAVRASLSPSHLRLLPLMEERQHEDEEDGYFYIGEDGVGSGLLACCRLMQMTEAELQAWLASGSQEASEHSEKTLSPIVLDSDEMDNDEEETEEVSATPVEQMREEAAEEEQDSEWAEELRLREQREAEQRRLRSRLLSWDDSHNGSQQRSAFTLLRQLLESWLTLHRRQQAEETSDSSSEARAAEAETQRGTRTQAVEWSRLLGIWTAERVRVVQSALQSLHGR